MNNQHNRPEVPLPAHSQRRREPLPGEQPKPKDVDPNAEAKQEAILNSSSYRPAIEDVDFLDSDDARGLRLQLDYLKTERLLHAH